MLEEMYQCGLTVQLPPVRALVSALGGLHAAKPTRTDSGPSVRTSSGECDGGHSPMMHLLATTSSSSSGGGGDGGGANGGLWAQRSIAFSKTDATEINRKAAASFSSSGGAGESFAELCRKVVDTALQVSTLQLQSGFNWGTEDGDCVGAQRAPFRSCPHPKSSTL